jgi:hypothetical protein
MHQEPSHGHPDGEAALPRGPGEAVRRACDLARRLAPDLERLSAVTGSYGLSALIELNKAAFDLGKLPGRLAADAAAKAAALARLDRGEPLGDTGLPPERTQGWLVRPVADARAVLAEMNAENREVLCAGNRARIEARVREVDALEEGLAELYRLLAGGEGSWRQFADAVASGDREAIARLRQADVAPEPGPGRGR